MTARNRIGGAWLVVPLLCACFDVPITGSCGFFDASCSPTSTSLNVRVFISGFPSERVDRTTTAGVDSYRGTLHVGDTVSLRLLVQIDSTAPSPVTIVKWELADSAIAHVTSDSGGIGRLTAIAPGRLPALVANGTSREVVACYARNVCTTVTEIDVVP